MGISRLLILGALLWLGWFIFKRVQENMLRRKAKVSKAKLESSDIVKCNVCDVHVPKTEAIESNGHYFCCIAHKNQ